MKWILRVLGPLSRHFSYLLVTMIRLSKLILVQMIFVKSNDIFFPESFLEFHQKLWKYVINLDNYQTDIIMSFDFSYDLYIFSKELWKVVDQNKNHRAHNFTYRNDDFTPSKNLNLNFIITLIINSIRNMKERSLN